MSNPPAIPQMQICSQCGRSLPEHEVVRIGEHWVCATCKPVLVQRLTEGVVAGTTGAARWKKLVAIGVNGSLPARCIKCNMPAEGIVIKRTLYWYPSWVSLLILVNLLVAAVVASLLKKTAIVNIPLCPMHADRRKRDILISWGLFASSILTLILAIAIESNMLGFIGVPLFLVAAIVYAIITTRLLTVRKITPSLVWLRGAGRPFLDSLPESQNRP